MAPQGSCQKDLTSYFGNEKNQVIGTKKRKFSAHGGKSKATRQQQQPKNRNISYGTCPLCNKQLPMPLLLSHASFCKGVENGKESTKKGNLKQPPPFSSANTSDNHTCVPKEEDESTTSFDKNEVHNFSLEQSQQICSKIKQNSTPNDNSEQQPWWIAASKQRQLPQNVIHHTNEPLPGLFHYEDFITEEEEAIILAELDGQTHPDEFLPWKAATFNGKNHGKRWGVHCNLRDKRVSAAEHPLPHFFTDIILPKLQRLVPMQGVTPNEANAIDYRRQQGDWLQSHVDDRRLSREAIANLSLAGDCMMLFCNEKGKDDDDRHRVLLKRRTLQVLTGKARYDYSHGIRNQDLLSDRRVSVTMRESPLTKSK